MESYKLMTDGYIQRQSDLALIPATLDNADYVQYLSDVENGAIVTNFDYEAEEQRQADDIVALTKAQQIADLKVQLDALDLQAIRPLLDGETTLLDEIKAQKAILRAQLQALL